VAVKRLRVSKEGKSLADAHQVSVSNLAFVHVPLTGSQEFCREALVWRQLRHPNVLHFLGIDAKTFSTDEKPVLCMVSPWMRRGTLMQYIISTDYDASLERDKLVGAFQPFCLLHVKNEFQLLDVALGLEYLHSQKTVHGDLHGVVKLLSNFDRGCSLVLLV
jgi:son of sevenless-like protein